GSVVNTSGFKLAGMLRFLDLDVWQQSFRDFGEDLRAPGGWRKYLGIFGIPLALSILAWLVWRRGRQTRRQTGKPQQRKVGWLRKNLAKVVGTVAPALGQWIAAEQRGPEEVPFYHRLTGILDKAGFTRAPSQTQREFAAVVAEQCAATDDDNHIGTLTKTITDFYYLVRFGHRPLNDQEQASVNAALTDLEAHIASRSANLS
ncbi:MAG: DUF4129 domain-containing protein, partial [Pirellulaceae bacterium]